MQEGDIENHLLFPFTSMNETLTKRPLSFSPLLRVIDALNRAAISDTIDKPSLE